MQHQQGSMLGPIIFWKRQGYQSSKREIIHRWQMSELKKTHSAQITDRVYKRQVLVPCRETLYYIYASYMYAYWSIYTGKRTEWSPIRCVIIQVHKWLQNQTTIKQVSSMIIKPVHNPPHTPAHRLVWLWTRTKSSSQLIIKVTIFEKHKE